MLGLFLGKFLKISALPLKACLGCVSFKKKYDLPTVMQTRFKPVQEWQISNNTVVRKQNTRSHKHWLLLSQKKRVTENSRYRLSTQTKITVSFMIHTKAQSHKLLCIHWTAVTVQVDAQSHQQRGNLLQVSKLHWRLTKNRLIR